MRVAIIGANGQLGMDVAEEFSRDGDDVCSLSHAEIDISVQSLVNRVLREAQPELVVNVAAMHHVEKCEQDPPRAYAVNALGARNVALCAQKLGATLVHVSTDYVFDGSKRKPYLENDLPLPLNVYGNTKLAGELFIRTITERHIILRTSAIYGKNPCRAKNGQNFVELMLKLAKERDHIKVVDDEIVSPTSTKDLAKQMVRLSRTDHFGVYHATAEGSCSWYEFAKKIFEMTKTKVCVSIAGPGEFPSKVLRPKYSVLENHRLKTHNLNLFHSWEDSLRLYLEDNGHIN